MPHYCVGVNSAVFGGIEQNGTKVIRKRGAHQPLTRVERVTSGVRDDNKIYQPVLSGFAQYEADPSDYNCAFARY